MASYVDIPLPRAPATSGHENYVMRAIDLNLMVRVPQAAGEVDGFFMLSSLYLQIVVLELCRMACRSVSQPV